jgi:S1-C subfamily serine protease
VERLRRIVGGADLSSALQVPYDVMVVGRTSDDPAPWTWILAIGDTIHGINGAPVNSVIDLRRALDRLKAKSAAALQSERNGQFIFLAFELD